MVVVGYILETRAYIYLIILTLFCLSCDFLEQPQWKNYTIIGIDVSKYQSKVNWHKAKKAGISFAFIKATEGHSLVDKQLLNNWKRAKKNAIKRGAYHFFRPSIPADKQARLFIRQIQLDEGDLPPVLDIEQTDNQPREVIIERAKQWLDIVEKHYKIRPIIYTNISFYHKFIYEDFVDYPLWIAYYSKQNPRPWLLGRSWLFWQYTQKGRLYGVKNKIDFNVFNGDSLALEKICVQ